jgi:preprotein translocase subunit SecA
MDRLGFDDETPIEHGMISKSIESAQTKVEGHNFDIRKHVVQYDDVMNRHREVIYGDRRKIVNGEDMSARIAEMVTEEIESIVARHADEKGGNIQYEEVLQDFTNLIPHRGDSDPVELSEIEGMSREDLIEVLEEDADESYVAVEERFGEETMRQVERHVLLSVIDRLWVEHLTGMDELREGVGLQAYGQRDPLVVYKTEGYRLFGKLLENMRHDVVHTIYRVQPAVAEQPLRTRVSEEAQTNLGEGASETKKLRKVGVNDPCPCGSGKKYKHCHGKRGAKQLVAR